MQDFNDEEKYRCVDREVALRIKVYPKLIRRGHMTAEKAEKEVAIMRAIAMDYYRATLRRTAVIAFFLLLLPTLAQASPDCMTKSQARALYKTAHLYWHTENHCWDNRAHRRIKADPPPKSKAAETKPVEPVVIADASGNGPIRRGKVAQEIVFPPLVASQSAIAADMYQVRRPITEWPLMLDLDATGPDPNNGIDGCCWPPLESLK